jgi:hypothetical protein
MHRYGSHCERRRDLATRPRNSARALEEPSRPSEAATQRGARAAGVFVCLYPPTHPGGITLDLVVYVLRAWASAVGVCRRLRTAETPMRFYEMLHDRAHPTTAAADSRRSLT